MSRRLSLTLAGAVAWGCGPAKPMATLIVDSPPDTDTSCIGVVGFDLTLRVAGTDRPKQILLRTAPVLSLDACRLPSATTIPDLPTDQTIDVVVNGYDSAGTLRVTGSSHADRLDDASIHLQLAAPVSSTGTAKVLVINRTTDLMGTPSDISRLELRTMQGNMSLLDLMAPAVAPWFTACDPGAFALGSAFTGTANLMATVTTNTGGPNPPVRLTPMPAMNGLYYDAVPQ